MYKFTGWFSAKKKGLPQAIREVWPEADVVEFARPFRGVGVREMRFGLCYSENREVYEREFAKPLIRLSRQFPRQTFVFIEVECWGGECIYLGEVFRNGQVEATYDGPEALRGLLSHVGVRLDDRQYFAPFDRAFNWNGGKSAPPPARMPPARRRSATGAFGEEWQKRYRRQWWQKVIDVPLDVVAFLLVVFRIVRPEEEDQDGA